MRLHCGQQKKNQSRSRIKRQRKFKRMRWEFNEVHTALHFPHWFTMSAVSAHLRSVTETILEKYNAGYTSSCRHDDNISPSSHRPCQRWLNADALQLYPLLSLSNLIDIFLSYNSLLTFEIYLSLWNFFGSYLTLQSMTHLSCDTALCGSYRLMVCDFNSL